MYQHKLHLYINNLLAQQLTQSPFYYMKTNLSKEISSPPCNIECTLLDAMHTYMLQMSWNFLYLLKTYRTKTFVFCSFLLEDCIYHLRMFFKTSLYKFYLVSLIRKLNFVSKKSKKSTILIRIQFPYMESW